MLKGQSENELSPSSQCQLVSVLEKEFPSTSKWTGAFFSSYIIDKAMACRRWC